MRVVALLVVLGITAPGLAAQDVPLAARTKGAANAPVTVYEMSDFQCPFCAVWAKDTEPTMMEYADAGDLRIEWRDINAFGPVSVRAAQAAFAAGQRAGLGKIEYGAIAEVTHHFAAVA